MAPYLVRKHNPRRDRGEGRGKIRFTRGNQPTSDREASAARASMSSSAFSSVARPRLIRFGDPPGSNVRLRTVRRRQMFATVPMHSRFALAHGIYKIPLQDRLNPDTAIHL